MTALSPCLITDLETALKWWQSCLAGYAKKPPENVAAAIAGIGCSDYCDEWCRTDSDFEYIFETASMLELPGDIYIPQEERADAWKELKRRMVILEQRYLTKKT